MLDQFVQGVPCEATLYGGGGGGEGGVSRFGKSQKEPLSSLNNKNSNNKNSNFARSTVYFRPGLSLLGELSKRVHNLVLSLFVTSYMYSNENCHYVEQLKHSKEGHARIARVQENVCHTRMVNNKSDVYHR